MAYYAIFNQIKMKFDYVVPSEVYIELLSRNTAMTNSVIIGDVSKAQEILETNRAEFIAQESYRFHVHKVWTHKYREWIVPCNLDEEPENTDEVYGVYDVMINDTIRVVGKSAALEYRKTVQNKFLDSVLMTSYQTLTFIPID